MDGAAAPANEEKAASQPKAETKPATKPDVKATPVAAAIIADKAPLYKIGIAPVLSKKPRLYKNPPKFIDWP